MSEVKRLFKAGIKVQREIDFQAQQKH